MRLVSIDKTDGAQVYLSEQSKNAEIVTAKSSEMNILVPKGDGDFVSKIIILASISTLTEFPLKYSKFPKVIC